MPEAKALTKARARDLGSMLTRYVRRHLPPPAPPKEPPSDPPRMVGAHARWLPVLQVIPALLVVLFVVSFFWDFDGVSADVFGRTLPFEGLLRIISVSGLIGFLTNWLAITMLFRPREKRPIFPQGLIPAQRERVIFRLAKAVSDELINAEIIAQKIRESGVIPKYRKLALDVTRDVIEDPEFREELRGLTASYAKEVLGSPQVRQRIVDFTVQKLEEHAKEGISGLALKVYRFVNEEDFQRRIEEAVGALPESIDVALDETDVLLDKLPAQIEARSEEIEALATKVVLGFVENLDVYGIIVGKHAPLRRGATRAAAEEHVERAAQLHQVPRRRAGPVGRPGDLAAALGPRHLRHARAGRLRARRGAVPGGERLTEMSKVSGFMAQDGTWKET